MMLAVFLALVCLSSVSLSAISSHKPGRYAVMTVRQERNSNTR